MNIVVLEDHKLFAQGMRYMVHDQIEHANVQLCETVSQAQELIQDRCDLLISDLEIPNEDVYAFLKHVSANMRIPVIEVTRHNKLSSIQKCLDLGVMGYLLKDDTKLTEAIMDVANGKAYFSEKVRRTLAIIENDKLPRLSKREEEILRLTALGKSNAEIAEELFISQLTVSTHRKNIKRILGDANLVSYYHKNYHD